MSIVPSPHQPPKVPDRPVFDGFPYMVTRLMPAVYHVTPLPKELSAGDLLDIVREQVRTRRFRACLVLASDSAVYVEPDGRELASTSIPSGGITASGGFKAPAGVVPTAELRRRTRHLERSAALRWPGGNVPEEAR